MSHTLETSAVTRVATLDSVRKAAETGESLIALWPLTDASQMDNDAKYGENLQVRITRLIASVFTGLEVTMPDAEFVYEGADEIPGRPQEIVDALLAANDAYDTMADYSETANSTLLLAAAETLGVEWDEGTAAAVSGMLDAIEAASAENLGSASDTSGLAGRFALALVAVQSLFALLAEGLESGTERALIRALPVLLYANELCERLSVPRLAPNAEQYRAMVAASAQGPEAMAEAVAPVADTEWARHREDVLWDPVEAKKKAREEDERKSKEALAAKFAHIKDDPNKETVEL